jgi:hypothetical protein
MTSVHIVPFRLSDVLANCAKEVLLKSYDSSMDRRGLSNVGVFIPNKMSGFVEVVILLTLPEGLYYGDNTDLSQI